MSSPPRVVLDTNVVLSALVFGGGAAARVRQGWQQGIFVPLTSTATAQELVRVLAYAKFRLSPQEQEELLADYLPFAKTVRIPQPPPAVPRCRDAFDLPFLHLAVAGRAKVLVSGDKDLLALDGKLVCPVMTLDSFAREFLAHACAESPVGTRKSDSPR